MSQLFPYQKVGIAFLSQRSHAVLADEMGLGKTIQAIRGLDRIHAKKTLILCPSVARINWFRELEEWAQTKRTYKIMHKLTDRTESKEDSVICSFDYALHNHKYLKEHGFDVLIVDEAQFIKDPTAKRTKAVLGTDGIIRGCKRTWLLTGTPAPNNASELWVMLYTFGQTKLTYQKFIDYFCTVRKTTFGPKITGTKLDTIPYLQELLKPIMLRRLKKDVMSQLPPIQHRYFSVYPGEVDLEVSPSFTHYFLPEDRRIELMDRLHKEQKLLEDVFYNMQSGNEAALAVINGLSNSVSTLRRYVGLQKVEGAVEWVDKQFRFANLKKLVIFALHTDVIEGLRSNLREFKPVVVFGKTPPEKRQRRIDKFQNDPKCKIFIGNIKAAGTAINLTAAHTMLFVEQDWVPGNNAQAVMRCHRIGQENPVSVYYVTLYDSIDHHVLVVLKKKIKELTSLFDTNNLKQEFDDDIFS